MDKAAVLEALKAAWAAPVVVASGPCGGCGRAYVCVSGDRATVNAFAAACRELGLMFLRKAYGTSGNALYVGYDNADGRALAKSHVVADELNKRGVKAYSDAVAD
jgi:hypothetical protein